MKKLGSMCWRPISTAPTKGRRKIFLYVPGREPQLAYSDTWWTCGFSEECKPTHWKPASSKKIAGYLKERLPGKVSPTYRDYIFCFGP